jgi:hypothetical protein
MEEYTYDFDDIVPSQDLVSHTSHQPHTNAATDDANIQPSKRVKLTHEEEKDPPPNPPDTQLTQLDGGRKIPGPAGTLPPIHPTTQPFPSKALVLSSQADLGLQQPDALLLQSKLRKKSVLGHGGMQDEYATDFMRGPWLVMLQHSELPPFGNPSSTTQSPPLRTYSHNQLLTLQQEHLHLHLHLHSLNTALATYWKIREPKRFHGL